MALELALAPLMVPISITEAALCHVHRQSSRYNPNCIVMESSSAKLYTVVPLKPTAQGGMLSRLLDKQDLFQVIDVESGEAVYEFRTSNPYSRATYEFAPVKSVRATKDKPAEGEEPAPAEEEVDDNADSIATVSAGVWSTIDVHKPTTAAITSSSLSLAQLHPGVNYVSHQSDFLDNYRVFMLTDGHTYQWTKRGMFLERVYNMGQKDSEIRERCGRVMLGSVRQFYEATTPQQQQCRTLDTRAMTSARGATVPPRYMAVVGGEDAGFSIEIDETRVDREVALMTAMVSFLDHWSTALGVGGVYYKLKMGGAGEVPWRRLSRS